MEVIEVVSRDCGIREKIAVLESGFDHVLTPGNIPPRT
jgi:hypothetical protein